MPKSWVGKVTIKMLAIGKKSGREIITIPNAMRSHVDMILFCSYLHIHSHELDNNFIDRIKKANSQELYDLWFEYRRSEKKISQLSFHETYHYYQGLTLPYMFWYSFSCVRGIFDVFRELCRNDTNFHNWEAQVIGFNNLSTIHNIEGQKGAFYLRENELTKQNSIIDLTLLDLIESATSLSQFQILVDYKDKTNPIAFKQWRIRNPAYLKVYNFLVLVFGDEKLVLRFIIPLINASFTTTQPMKAFIDLINNFGHFIEHETSTFQKFIGQQEPCNWTNLFEYIISHYIQFENDADSTVDAVNPPFCRLNIEHWVDSNYGIFGSTPITHPFINFHASEWIRRSKSNPSYTLFLDFPGYMPGNFLQELFKDFLPAITFLRFHIDGINDKVLSFGSLGVTHKYLFPIPIPDLMTMYSAVKRATKIQYIEEHRLCHHSECPEFRFNYCNSYPIIPIAFENCGFQKRIKDLIQILK